MDVQLTEDVQATLDMLANETGRSRSEFVQDALAGYLDELARTRGTLDSRYDELKNRAVRTISASEVSSRIQAKSTARRV